jgi:hypothetical protein
MRLLSMQPESERSKSASSGSGSGDGEAAQRMDESNDGEPAKPVAKQSPAHPKAADGKAEKLQDSASVSGPSSGRQKVR